MRVYIRFQIQLLLLLLLQAAHAFRSSFIPLLRN